MQGGEIFVPKIPSMRVTDLAAALAPGSETRLIGIRPGEKIHEMLLAEDESHRALEYDESFVIEPGEPTWPYVPRADGKRVPAGFVYRSDTNQQWLSTDELRTTLAGEGFLPEAR
jgi:UDP-N-acetylglucosamine 4,6-dehydratase